MTKIILVLLIFAAAAFSQSLLGVRYPTGISYPASTNSARMGGVGTALKEPYLVSTLNPANLGSINQSVYTLAINVDYVRVKENDLYADFSDFSPALVGFAFPLGKAGTFGASFRQNGSNKYSFQDRAFLVRTENGLPLLNPTREDSIPVLQKFDNTISFSTWEFGWGREFFRRRLAVGATYQHGQYKNRFYRSDVLERTGVSSGLDSIYFNQSSPAVRGGISGQFGQLGLGVSATYPFMDELKAHRSVQRLTMDRNKNYSVSQKHQFASFDTSYKMQLPPSGNIGVSWEFNQRLKTAADFSLTFWDNYYWTDAPLLTYDDGELANAFSMGAGVQFIPQPTLLSARYFQKAQYSGGFSYRQLPIDGDYELSLALGMGFPLGARGVFDVSVETGWRRSDFESDIRENFLRINFGISGGQVWRRASGNTW